MDKISREDRLKRMQLGYFDDPKRAKELSRPGMPAGGARAAGPVRKVHPAVAPKGEISDQAAQLIAMALKSMLRSS